MNRRSRQQGLVVSDLHLFAGRSEGFAHMEGLRPKLKEMDRLILNGDIFDFAWSARPLAESQVVALEWLSALLADYPDCELHYIMGNHDSVAEFQGKLTELADQSPRFHIHDDFLHLGDKLFLHGDCTSRTMNASALHEFRQRWREHRRQWGPLALLAYRVSDILNATDLVHRFLFPPRRAVKRICHYMDQVHPAWRSQVRNCYFGHTHLPLVDFEYQGIRFYNTGSAIKGMAFQPLTVELLSG